MKFSTRLFLCLAIPAVLFIASLGNSVWGLIRTQKQFDNYIRTEQSIRAGLSEMYAQGTPFELQIKLLPALRAAQAQGHLQPVQSGSRWRLRIDAAHQLLLIQ